MDDFAAAVVAFAMMQPNDADPIRQLTDIQQQLAKAWLAGDRATIERIIAPEWNLTGPNGEISTRADVLRDVFRDPRTPHHYPHS